MSFDISGMGGMRPPGVGGMGRPSGVGGPPPGIDALKEGVESGEIDTEQFQARLEERFGDSAAGIVGEDGSIDFDSLESMMTDQRTQMMQDKLQSRFGEEAAQGIIGEDGSVDTDKLKGLFASQDSQVMANFDQGGNNQNTLLEMLSNNQTDQAYGPGGNQESAKNSTNFRSLIDVLA